MVEVMNPNGTATAYAPPNAQLPPKKQPHPNWKISQNASSQPQTQPYQSTFPKPPNNQSIQEEQINLK